jgi:hypothetical protein
MMSLERAIEDLHCNLTAALHGSRHVDLVDFCSKDTDHFGHQLPSFVCIHLSHHD